MELKISKNTFKKKLEKYLLKKGKKELVEKGIKKKFKQAQKQNKKNSNSIFKIAILNTTPAFRLVKLTNKKRKKKSTKQIPMFLLKNQFRSFWGLKNIIRTSLLASKPKTFYKKIFVEYLNTAKSESNSIISKKTLQNTVLKEKNHFKYYRW